MECVDELVPRSVSRLSTIRPLNGIRVTNLVKSYCNRKVLDKVSLDIDPGSVVALCGSSGAGKTTLVRIICGLLDFDDGEIAVGGGHGAPHLRPTVVRPNATYPRELYGKIGVVFQENNLFPHMTVLQNVRFALVHVYKFPKAEATERAMHELELMGLAGKEKQYPSRLSGGERQRVAIARALAFEPVLLLLDEPTSSLDPSTVRELLDILGKLASAGTTMLVITHNIRFGKMIGQRFAVLKNNKLEVSDDNGLLTRMECDW